MIELPRYRWVDMRIMAIQRNILIIFNISFEHAVTLKVKRYLLKSPFMMSSCKTLKLWYTKWRGVNMCIVIL